MADLRFTAPTGPAEILLTGGGGAKTILSVAAPANQRVKCRGFGISFDGTDPTEAAVLVELCRYDDAAGSGTGVSGKKEDESLPEVVQSVLSQNFSAESTLGDIVRQFNIHPQDGEEQFFPEGQEIVIKGGGWFGLRCTVTGANVNAVAHLKLEE